MAWDPVIVTSGGRVADEVSTLVTFAVRVWELFPSGNRSSERLYLIMGVFNEGPLILCTCVGFEHCVVLEKSVDWLIPLVIFFLFFLIDFISVCPWSGRRLGLFYFAFFFFFKAYIRFFWRGAWELASRPISKQKGGLIDPTRKREKTARVVVVNAKRF
jgi:hypothetical protein